MKIILDLHAAPGSQNGFEHSSSRDGSQEWGKTDETIQQTVHVIDFLTARFISYIYTGQSFIRHFYVLINCNILYLQLYIQDIKSFPIACISGTQNAKAFMLLS